MIFSVIRTTDDGSDIMVLETDQEGLSAEVPTPGSFSEVVRRMKGQGGMVRVISVTTVEI